MMSLTSLSLLFGILSISIQLAMALPQGCACNGKFNAKGSGECQTKHEGYPFCYVPSGQCTDEQESSQEGWFWSYKACEKKSRCACNGKFNAKGSGECQTTHEGYPFCYVPSNQCADEQESSQEGWFWSYKACAENKRTSSSECLTVGGDDSGASCVFPFIFKNKVYNGCTLAGADDGKPWCSTKVDSQGVHVSGEGKWGHCGQECAKDEGTRSTLQESDLLSSGTRIGSNVPEGDCRCSEHVETDHKGKQTGKCLTEFRGSFWCYLESNSNCHDKKQSKKNPSLFWSHIGCQTNTDEESGDAVTKMECEFDDNELVSLQRSTHEFPNLWFNGKVPYVFTQQVGSADKELFRRLMKQIEEKTCFRFIPNNSPPRNEKYLEITVDDTSYNSCDRGWFNAIVTRKFLRSSNKIQLRSKYKLADKAKCKRNPYKQHYEGWMLHEFFHVFGVGHTHKRKDRDNYIEVNPNNIWSQSQFQKCHGCKIYPQIPYECNSLMHYGSQQYRKYGAGPTMTGKSSSCKINRWPSIVATSKDWELLKIIANQACGSSAGCSCNDFMNAAGFGQCKRNSPAFGGVPICYVNLPSTCTDAKESLSDQGQWKSAEACGQTSTICIPTTNDVLGPFFEENGLTSYDIAPSQELGKSDQLVVEGRVLDSACNPVAGATVEAWYAGGEKAAYTFPRTSDTLWYRAKRTTNQNGEYSYRGTFPGVYSGRPIRHIHYKITDNNRGVEMVTQLYFNDFVPPSFEDYVRGRDTQFPTEFGQENVGMKAVFNVVLE